MRLILGDCVERMRELDAGSVDAVVTDPPYGINFMGKTWDGKAIEEAASRPRDISHLTRLTGGADSPSRKLIERSGSAFANRAGEAGSYDFSPKGNRAFQAWTQQWAEEALRVLKPGGHLLAFGGTRTYHRLAAGIEDAGFEIRDTLAWLYGSGFPKSLDVSKAIDKAAGAERGVVCEDPHSAERSSVGWLGAMANAEGRRYVTAPATEDAARWQGWGTALKPAFEPVVMARKPLNGTVAANVLAFGTGALNVGVCRIGDAGGTHSKSRGEQQGVTFAKGALSGDFGELVPGLGRWPANVILDEVAAAALDAQTGDRPGFTGGGTRGAGFRSDYVGGADKGWTKESPSYYGDSGGASRFFLNVAGEGQSRQFYQPKASRAERNAGLDGFELSKSACDGYGTIQQPKLDRAAPRENWTPHRTANHHPTVKPINLMRWLVRLVTPPGGTILDPFLGSGTTGAAAELEGFEFVGIEREADYLAIAEARIRFWAEHGVQGLEIVARRERADRERETRAASGQTDIFSLTEGGAGA